VKSASKSLASGAGLAVELAFCIVVKFCFAIRLPWVLRGQTAGVYTRKTPWMREICRRSSGR